ncbi:hypothetical protein J2R73_011549 [Bradyrhizobium japonicum]|nr:hypothetical protein [Bradyrhizobium japonicum]
MDKELSQEREGCLEGYDHQHRDAEHIERVVRLVEDHLVRQQAPEHDRRQAEKPEDHGGNRDVADHAAFAEQQRGYQAETERLRFVRYLVAALDQDQIAGPDTFKAWLVDHEQRVFRGIRVPQHDAGIVGVSLDTLEYHVAPIAKPNDDRERLLQMRQPAPIELDALRAHACFLRTADKLMECDVLFPQKVVLNEL